MSKIIILGVGPGSPLYLTPQVREKALGCDLLLGGKRNLKLFSDFAGEKRIIDGDMTGLLAFIRANLPKKMGILVSGDPGLYSLLPLLRRHFSPELLEVVPGISAMQYFFALLKLPWHDAVILSLHGRELHELPEVVRRRAKVGLFTDRQHTPGTICRLLLKQGIKGRRVHIGENLSYPEEKIYSGTLEECRDLEVGPLNVMVILKEEDGETCGGEEMAVCYPGDTR